MSSSSSKARDDVSDGVVTSATATSSSSQKRNAPTVMEANADGNKRQCTFTIDDTNDSQTKEMRFEGRKRAASTEVDADRHVKRQCAATKNVEKNDSQSEEKLSVSNLHHSPTIPPQCDLQIPSESHELRVTLLKSQKVGFKVSN